MFRQLYSKVVKLKERFDAIVVSCSLYQAANCHFFSIEILINKQTLVFFSISFIVTGLDIMMRILDQAYEKVKVIY